jgi:hypothetical protein
MLYSRTKNIALAHYPKTAGSSLRCWFQQALPDAVASDSRDAHTPVRQGLKRFRITAQRQPWERIVDLMPGRRRLPKADQFANVLVIGVMREPFEMLVSLYAFWRRRFPERRHPEGTLAHLAATAGFHAFLQEAVKNGRLPNYHTFFDVGGPAWPTTRLVDFRFLEPGLRAVCQAYGISPPQDLPMANVAPQGHDYAAYRAEAGPLLPAIRSHFHWYYEQADAIMVRGLESPVLPAAA